MKRAKIIGAIILIVAVAVFFLLPRSLDLERYELLYQGGHYAQVSRNLKKELKGRPQWQEGRKLLIQAELKQNKLESAVSHLLALEEETGIARVAQFMNEWLESNKVSQDEAGQALKLLSQWVQEKSAAPEIYSLFIHMVALYQEPSLIPESLKLAIDAPVNLTSEIEGLFYHAISRAYDKGNIASLWDLAVANDSIYSSDDRLVLNLRANVVQRLSLAEVEFLRADHPGDALLAIKHALMLEPTAGLEFLRGWERQYTVDRSSALSYSEMKRALLAGVEQVELGDFAYIDFAHLLDLATSNTHQPTKCHLILDYLDEHNFEPVITQAARDAIKGPQPTLRMDKYAFSISPDGEKILSFDGLGVYLHTGKREIKLVDKSFLGLIYWSSDSSQFVLQTGSNQLVNNTIVQDLGKWGVYSVGDGVGKDLSFSFAEYNMLGWKGPNILWIQKQQSDDRGSYYEYNIETEEIVPTQVVAPTWAGSFHPSPDGHTAWSGSNGFALSPEDEPHSLPGTFVDWIPDGSGLLLRGDDGLCLWTGGELEPTGLDGRLLGWRNDRVFYWSPLWMGKSATKLMGYDIMTGEVIDYIALGSWREAKGKTAIALNPTYYFGGFGLRSFASFVYYIP